MFLTAARVFARRANTTRIAATLSLGRVPAEQRQREFK
jgi:hypothetical protein